MFPREITSTSFWIRHELPLCAPPPIDGDKKLCSQMKRRFVNATADELSEIVRQERARLNLKWCLDEYFGGYIWEPFLGQLVTANVIGVVHLAYIVDITSKSVTILLANTLDTSAVVAFEDLYSAEDGPFLDVFLCTHRVYSPQHILDWWTEHNQRQMHITLSHTNHLSSVSTCNDVVLDCQQGEETWFVHDLLPQRSQSAHRKQQVTPSVSTSDVVGHPAPSSSSAHIDHLPSMIPDPPLNILLCPSVSVAEPVQQQIPSLPSLVADLEHLSSGIVVPPTQLDTSQYSPPAIIVRLPITGTPDVEPRKPLPSVYPTPSFPCRSTESSFPLHVLLAIYSVDMSSHPSSYLASTMLLSSTIPLILVFVFMSSYAMKARLLYCKVSLREVNDRDWFRVLAVP
jgi:hypothetical protein